MIPPRSSALALLLVLAWSPVVADVVTLTPIKDNTLFESPSGSFSNGQGSGMFVGRTAEDYPEPPFMRRSLVAFDIASAVPPGAEIDSVFLTLTMNRMENTASRMITVHEVMADWGEGSSNAGDTHDEDGAQALV